MECSLWHADPMAKASTAPALTRDAPAETQADKRVRQKRALDEAQRRVLANEANRKVLTELAKR